jgi:hypothetical protein
MNTLQNFACALLGLLTTALAALSADGPASTAKSTESAQAAAAPRLAAPATSTGFYADTFLSLRTADFSAGDYLYGVGVGCQVSPYWAIDGRLTHHGLDADGSAVQSIGGRLVARMPFDFVAPYSFLGGTFDLERDEWRLQPGGGIELGLSKKLTGLRLFAEGGLDADLKGRSGYLFGAGGRLRF